MARKQRVEVLGMEYAKQWARDLDLRRKQWKEKLPKGDKQLSLPAKRDYLHPPSEEVALQWLSETEYAVSQIEIWMGEYAAGKIEGDKKVNLLLKQELDKELTFWYVARTAVQCFLGLTPEESELVRKAFQLKEALRLSLELIKTHENELKLTDQENGLLTAIAALAREIKLY